MNLYFANKAGPRGLDLTPGSLVIQLDSSEIKTQLHLIEELMEGASGETLRKIGEVYAQIFAFKLYGSN